MSRIGKQPIPVPDGVTVEITPECLATVKGPKGELTRQLNAELSYESAEGEITVSRPSESKTHRSQHGLNRTLLANMVEGVSKGFTRELEIEGTGYKAELKGKSLHLFVGLSHDPVVIEPPDGISFEVPQPVAITVHGFNKEVVGQTAAEIRGWRPPEPYKGKGVRYKGEHIIRKAGKAAAKE